jgi:hypothetical protein
VKVRQLILLCPEEAKQIAKVNAYLAKKKGSRVPIDKSLQKELEEILSKVDFP